MKAYRQDRHTLSSIYHPVSDLIASTLADDLIGVCSVAQLSVPDFSEPPHVR